MCSLIMQSLSDLKYHLRKNSSLERAQTSRRFFKTGKGEYGEGDEFLGLTVPDCRKIAREFIKIEFKDVKKHLESKYHEERLVAFLILVEQFKKSDSHGKRKIYDFYIDNKEYANNWDLVDLTADKIVGEWLIDKDMENSVDCVALRQNSPDRDFGTKSNKTNQNLCKSILHDLARSDKLWDKRIAIVATFAFIKKRRFDETLNISEMLLKDKHDLIHKACGWMLREVGKRDIAVLERFLKKNYKNMPRTMLRYAIERFDYKTRKAYLEGYIDNR